ncbi:MAG: hypothetical protein WC373_06690 [Smithella sp.]|jgi:hypothetical protein
MDHPISDTYLDRRIARVEAALPAAGAWDTAPIELPCPVFKDATLYFKYTRGGAGGSFDFMVEVSPDGANFYQTSIYSPGAVVPGADTGSDIQREFINYQAIGANAEYFTYGPLELKSTAEVIRINAREVGAVGTPGDLGIQVVFA